MQLGVGYLPELVMHSLKAEEGRVLHQRGLGSEGEDTMP